MATPSPTPSPFFTQTPNGPQYGVSPPASLAVPTQRDIERNEVFLQRLRALNLYPSAQDAAARQDVLGELLSEVRTWARKVLMAKFIGEQEANEIAESARVYSFGSYRLGVSGPNSDVDAVCVVPQHLSREDFFTTLVERLKARPDVREFSAVPDAFAPVIKMEMRGIEMDVLFARLSHTVIPANLDLFNDAVLNGLDDKSVRALNGVRVADSILMLVPNPENFKTTLRAIKCWASRRGVYGNGLGFFAGVTLAILVARVCQLYPNALPVTLVGKFFLFFSRYWAWPKPIELRKTQHGGILHEQVWNPNLNFRDRKDLMPIITPCYPAMNSTYNVSASTKLLITREIQRGADLFARIEKGEEQLFDEFFEKLNFFSSYTNFLRIDCMAETVPEFTTWRGFVEAKLRHLILHLQDIPGVDYVHPHAKGFKVVGAKMPHCAAFFMGVQLRNLPGQPKPDITNAVIMFVGKVNEWERKTPNMHVAPSIVSRSKIPPFVFEQGEPPLPRESAEPRKKRPRKEEDGDGAQEDGPQTKKQKNDDQEAGAAQEQDAMEGVTGTQEVVSSGVSNGTNGESSNGAEQQHQPSTGTQEAVPSGASGSNGAEQHQPPIAQNPVISYEVLEIQSIAPTPDAENGETGPAATSLSSTSAQ